MITSKTHDQSPPSEAIRGYAIPDHEYVRVAIYRSRTLTTPPPLPADLETRVSIYS